MWPMCVFAFTGSQWGRTQTTACSWRVWTEWLEVSASRHTGRSCQKALENTSAWMWVSVLPWDCKNISEEALISQETWLHFHSLLWQEVYRSSFHSRGKRPYGSSLSPESSSFYYDMLNHLTVFPSFSSCRCIHAKLWPALIKLCIRPFSQELAVISLKQRNTSSSGWAPGPKNEEDLNGHDRNLESESESDKDFRD